MRLLLRPRVLHLTQPVDGGVARVVTDLVRAQLADGFDVTVACPDGALGGHLRVLGADVRPWNAARAPGRSLPREVRQLVRLIDDVRPDLVHAHSAKAGLAGRLAVRGRIPTVFQPHAWSFEAVDGSAAVLARAWERWGARWATRVVCVSEGERATGVRAGITARWRIVPNGVDPHRFHPAAAGTPAYATAEAPPRTPAAAAGAPLVVCVGRLCRQKGQDVLLRAWGTVADRVPGARLVLVGDGPDRERLRRLAPASVEFAGAVADPVPWYRAADVVVLPSRWEGMALAPLEAMACGRPVVVTDVDGARESLPPALAARCLVPAEDPAALARAVTELLLDPPLRASLGRLGRTHVLTSHNARRGADAITALYRDLLTARLTTARRVPVPRPAPATRTAPAARPEPATPPSGERPAADRPTGTGPAGDRPGGERPIGEPLGEPIGEPLGEPLGEPAGEPGGAPQTGIAPAGAAPAAAAHLPLAEHLTPAEHARPAEHLTPTEPLGTAEPLGSTEHRESSHS